MLLSLLGIAVLVVKTLRGHFCKRFLLYLYEIPFLLLCLYAVLSRIQLPRSIWDVVYWTLLFGPHPLINAPLLLELKPTSQLSATRGVFQSFTKKGFKRIVLISIICALGVFAILMLLRYAVISQDALKIGQ